ncbi:hypothetical protein [Shewanella sp. YQ_9]|uniref:hypothetical protein n=1 Tax=Shewanella sp. YQ_9 TaxID=3367231 RepID=UPI00370AB67D
MTIETSMIVRTVHTEKVTALFASTDIEILNQVSDDSEGITKLQIGGINCRGDLRLEVILDHLRQQGISYSYYWQEHNCNQGGESHYRSNGKEDQHLSWMDYEKDVVNIEDVRQAVAQGETAVLELLEASETRFTPWDWKEVAA